MSMCKNKIRRNLIINKTRNFFDKSKIAEAMGEFSKAAVSHYAVLSELISTVYNLSALVKSSTNKSQTDLTTNAKIKRWLTILEYCQTCLELAAMSWSGDRKVNRAKWIIVALVQLSKCAGRLLLLLKYKEGLLPYPPIQVKREFWNYPEAAHTPRSCSYILKSGRRVRSVRQIYVQNNETDDEIISCEAGKELSNLELAAEAAYIIKPIAHLGTLYLAGRKSWKPWLISLAIDVASLIVLHQTLYKEELTISQKKQIIQRRLSLLLYLLRSPFYDRNTRQVFEIVLYSLEMFVPCTSRFIVRPLLSHLPLVQQIYFYLWSH